jgi:uncharacterized phiE125 gp8 family phage protein
MGFVVVTPPAAEPISLAEFKLAARVTNAAEDTLITSVIIPAARRRYETDTRRQVVTATYDWFLCDFPPRRSGEESRIEIPLPPLASITSVKYVDVEGTLQVLDSAKYKVTQGKEPGQIYPAPEEEWPETQTTLTDERVQIRFVAGRAVGAVDPVDKMAIQLLALHWFENREAVIVDERVSIESLPLGYEALVRNRQITVM